MQALTAVQALSISPEAAASLLHTAARTLPSTAAAAAAAPPPKPLSWDLQVVHGINNAKAKGESVFSAFMSFCATKLTNRSKARVQLSDLVWSFMGMFLAVTCLGVMNLHVRTWPVVGEWHQQGLGLLLGSFGTLCVLIFGRPDAEAVRLWNFLAGHVVATTTVLCLLHVLGPGILSRALAMALMIAAMLFTDSVHPPGGALVLMAVDSAAIQRMDWWFMLYPSLAITVVLLLPLGIAVNWLKRNVKFDLPSASSSPAPAPPPPLTELRPKVA